MELRKTLKDNKAFGGLQQDTRFQTLLLAMEDVPEDWTEPRGFDARLTYTPTV